MEEIRQVDPDRLESNCSTVLFGSFAKYGTLARDETDVDIFFLVDDVPKDEVPSSRVRSESAERTMGRRIDATVMGRTQFERLLRAGDPFASHVLVTGCRLEDPDDQFGILARGFRGKYDRYAVLSNAIDRYRMRWLRVCILENRSERDYLQACNQWSLAVMQYFVVKADYPLDSLLMVSVLANARHAMREFAKRFTDIDENYFVSLMLQAKGIDPTTLGLSGRSSLLLVSRPTIREMVQKFHRILSASYGEADLEMLLPGELIRGGELPSIIGVYHALSDLLDELTADAVLDELGYGGAIEKEQEILQAVAKEGQAAGHGLTTLDYLFFFRLHRLFTEEGVEINEDRQLELCKSLRERWLDEVASSDGPVRSG